MTDSSNSATRGKGPVFVRTRAFFFGGWERSAKGSAKMSAETVTRHFARSA